MDVTPNQHHSGGSPDRLNRCLGVAGLVIVAVDLHALRSLDTLLLNMMSIPQLACQLFYR